jgi:hypothetical protein
LAFQGPVPGVQETVMATNTSFREQIRSRQPDWRGPWRRGFRWWHFRFEEYRVCAVVHPVAGVRDFTWLEWRSDVKT